MKIITKYIIINFLFLLLLLLVFHKKRYDLHEHVLINLHDCLFVSMSLMKVEIKVTVQFRVYTFHMTTSITAYMNSALNLVPNKHWHSKLDTQSCPLPFIFASLINLTDLLPYLWLCALSIYNSYSVLSTCLCKHLVCMCVYVCAACSRACVTPPFLRVVTFSTSIRISHLIPLDHPITT